MADCCRRFAALCDVAHGFCGLTPAAMCYRRFAALREMAHGLCGLTPAAMWLPPLRGFSGISREATAARSPWRQPGVNGPFHFVSREAATAHCCEFAVAASRLIAVPGICICGLMPAAICCCRFAANRFDMVADRERQREYGNNLFAGFYALTQKGLLSLLVVSHQPYAALVPAGHPVSLIAFDTVELRRLP